LHIAVHVLGTSYDHSVASTYKRVQTGVVCDKTIESMHWPSPEPPCVNPTYPQRSWMGPREPCACSATIVSTSWPNALALSTTTASR